MCESENRTEGYDFLVLSNSRADGLTAGAPPEGSQLVYVEDETRGGVQVHNAGDSVSSGTTGNIDFCTETRACSITTDIFGM